MFKMLSTLNFFIVRETKFYKVRMDPTGSLSNSGELFYGNICLKHSLKLQRSFISETLAQKMSIK